MSGAGQGRLAGAARARTVAAFIAVALLLPVSMHFFAYYGFLSRYTTRIFHRESFEAKFNGQVFRYRVLGPWLFLKTDEALEQLPRFPNGIQNGDLARIDKDASAPFYESLFLFNAFFAALAAAAFFAALGAAAPGISLAERACLTALLDAAVAMAQFVVTPYDNLSLFLIALGCWLAVRPMALAPRCALLFAVTALCTAARESSALIPAFAGALYFSEHGLKRRREIAAFAAAAAGFAAAYIGLHCYFGWHDMFEARTWGRNWGAGSLASDAFCLGMLLTLAAGTRRPARGLLVLAIAAPYIVSVFTTGIVFEMRLWLPLLLVFALACRTETGAARPAV